MNCKGWLINLEKLMSKINIIIGKSSFSNIPIVMLVPMKVEKQESRTQPGCEFAQFERRELQLGFDWEHIDE